MLIAGDLLLLLTVSPPLAGVFTDVWGATRAEVVVVSVFVSAREAIP